MKNVLIISGHPDLHTSVANTAILDELAQTLPNANIRKLDELYPSYQIDVKSEQQAILDADIIVWQFPFHWYSMPALMKRWLDEVFLHGFSHGSNGKLGGKKLIISTTTGAQQVVYQEDAVMKHTMEQLLAPFDSIAALCNLDLQQKLYLNGVSYTNRENTEKIQAQQRMARDYAATLVSAINEAIRK